MRYHFWFTGHHHGSAVAEDRQAALRKVVDTFPHLAGRAIVAERIATAYTDSTTAGRVSAFTVAALSGELVAKAVA